MVLVIGIDFGSENCVMSLAARGGIDIVLNEVSSKRYTPTMIAFNEKERVYGGTAPVQYAMNAKNTVPYVKKLLGKNYSQISKEDLELFPCKILKGNNDSIFVEVMYKNKVIKLTPVQIVGMIFADLRRMAERKSNSSGTSAVIAIPPYYNDKQRRAILQACKIAEIDCIRLIHDNTAAATIFGIYKEDLPKDNPEYIAFVNVGDATTSVSIVGLSEGKLKVISSRYDENLGALNFQRELVKHFLKEIKEKKGVDITTNIRSYLRLQKECVKLSKILSANSKGKVPLDCLLGDMDYVLEMERDAYELLCKDVLTRIKKPIFDCLEFSGLQTQDITSVQIIGGGSFIPSVKKLILEVFNKEPSTSLNASECVARGCGMQGAMNSSGFHLARKFEVTDYISHPISLSWLSNGEEKDQVKKSSLIFKLKSPTPTGKLLTFNKNENFDIHAHYSDMSLLPVGTLEHITQFSIGGLKNKEADKVRVRIDHNKHGIVAVSYAESLKETMVMVKKKVLKKVEEDVKMKEKKNDKSTKKKKDIKKQKEEEEKKKKEEAEKTEEQKQKEEDDKWEEIEKEEKKTIIVPLKVKTIAQEYTKKEIKRFFEIESDMKKSDDLIRKCAELKNKVETNVYLYLERIETNLQDFMTEEEKEKFMNDLNETEEWLYGEGEDTTAEKYSEKNNFLTQTGEVYDSRFNNFEKRPILITKLQNVIKEFRNFATSKDEKYSHIKEEEKKKVSVKCDEIETWLKKKIQIQSTLKKFEASELTFGLLVEKTTELIQFGIPIQNTPKPPPPKVEEKKEKEPKKDGEAKQNGDAPKSEESKKEEPKKDEKEETKEIPLKKDEGMDLD